MVFNPKLCRLIMFTNSSKNEQGYCNPKKIHFDSQSGRRSFSSTANTEWILNQKKHEFYQKKAKKKCYKDKISSLK